jgi:hypothetical protein
MLVPRFVVRFIALSSRQAVLYSTVPFWNDTSYVWGLAEKFYVSSLSTVVFSTIGNAILSPAFEHAMFDAIIIDEATNIAETPTVALLSRFS